MTAPVDKIIADLRKLQSGSMAGFPKDTIEAACLTLTASGELLRDIKTVFAGDAAPHWVNHWETTTMRGHYLDRIDSALGNIK